MLVQEKLSSGECHLRMQAREGSSVGALRATTSRGVCSGSDGRWG